MTIDRCLGLALTVALVVLPGCASSSRGAGASPETAAQNPMAATLLMEQGQALANQGRFDAGIAKYEAAVKLQPQNPTIYNLLGQVLLAKGDATKALDDFNHALQLAPTYSDARNNRGAAYAALRQFTQAESDYLTVLADRTYQNRAGTLFNLGALYAAQGNYAAAEENLRQAATPAGPVAAYALLGKVEVQLGKPDVAENVYRQALARAPERADIMMALAGLYQTENRDKEATELYERVVAIAPGSKEAAQARTHLRR
jgi:tetratricopeptide (TPR) repeat protein